MVAKNLKRNDFPQKRETLTIKQKLLIFQKHQVLVM